MSDIPAGLPEKWHDYYRRAKSGKWAIAPHAEIALVNELADATLRAESLARHADKLVAERDGLRAALERIADMSELHPGLLHGEFRSIESQRTARAALDPEKP
jgi:hypothetical protein